MPGGQTDDKPRAIDELESSHEFSMIHGSRATPATPQASTPSWRAGMRRVQPTRAGLQLPEHQPAPDRVDPRRRRLHDAGCAVSTPIGYRPEHYETANATSWTRRRSSLRLEAGRGEFNGRTSKVLALQTWRASCAGRSVILAPPRLLAQLALAVTSSPIGTDPAESPRGGRRRDASRLRACGADGWSIMSEEPLHPPISKVLARVWGRLEAEAGESSTTGLSDPGARGSDLMAARGWAELTGEPQNR